MSSKNKNKIIGGDTSSKILKIPLGTQYPVQFKPNFEVAPSDTDMSDIFDRIKLKITSLDGSVTEYVNGMRAGEEVIFTITTQSISTSSKKAAASAGIGQGVYWGQVVCQEEYTPASKPISNPGNLEAKETTENGGKLMEEVFSEFPFQVVNDGDNGSLTPETIFSVFQSLPDDIKKLQDVNVSLQRTTADEGPDAALWRAVRLRAQAFSFAEYQRFMDSICGGTFDNYTPKASGGASKDTLQDKIDDIEPKRFLPFTDTDSYRTVKVLTEAFLLANCAADITAFPNYSVDFDGAIDGARTIPFLETIRRKLRDLAIKPKSIGDVLNTLEDFTNENENGEEADNQNCYGILQDSLTNPCFIELIWNYWHEESMLVQSMNAISLRFQNMRNPNRKDPLAGLEIAPLRPLNNLLWGYVQDEQHRLSVKRRAYEYDHHYGISLVGKAIPAMHSADSRTRFLEAFHNLLHLCAIYFTQEDDTTKVPDGYPILNALREVHLLLSQGMHNQYGDLPFTARVEMMMQQWILARPEFREFLPTRTMTAYPEPWMDRVAAMNHIQGWTDSSPVSFSYLGIYGEMILLSIRYGNWTNAGTTSNMASFWASFFRNEIQGYIHAYRVVTGIDLTKTNPQTGKIDIRPPAFHLIKRLQKQKKVLRAG